MENLNALQVSFLLNISKEAALYKILKHTKKPDQMQKVLNDLEKSDFREHEIGIKKLSDAEGIDINLLLKSINEDFTKSWECTQYLLKKMHDKYKENPKTKLYPLTLRIPSEISSLMNNDARERVLDFMKRNCVASGMKEKDGSPKKVIYKI